METPRERSEQQPPKQTTLVYICGGHQAFAIFWLSLLSVAIAVSNCHAELLSDKYANI